MPIRPKREQFPDGDDKKAKFSVRIPILFFTPSSYLNEANASRGRTRFFYTLGQTPAASVPTNDPSTILCPARITHQLNAASLRATSRNDYLKERTPFFFPSSVSLYLRRDGSIQLSVIVKGPIRCYIAHFGSQVYFWQLGFVRSRWPTTPPASRCPAPSPSCLRVTLPRTWWRVLTDSCCGNSKQSVAARGRYWQLDKSSADAYNARAETESRAAGANSGFARQSRCLSGPRSWSLPQRSRRLLRAVPVMRSWQSAGLRLATFTPKGCCCGPPTTSRSPTSLPCPMPIRRPSRLPACNPTSWRRSQYARRLAESGLPRAGAGADQPRAEAAQRPCRADQPRVPLPLGLRAGPAPDRLRGAEGPGRGRLVCNGKRATRTRRSA